MDAYNARKVSTWTDKNTYGILSVKRIAKQMLLDMEKVMEEPWEKWGVFAPVGGLFDEAYEKTQRMMKYIHKRRVACDMETFETLQAISDYVAWVAIILGTLRDRTAPIKSLADALVWVGKLCLAIIETLYSMQTMSDVYVKGWKHIVYRMEGWMQALPE